MNLADLAVGHTVRMHPNDPMWGGVPGIIIDTIDNGRSALVAVDRDEETGRLVTIVAMADELTPA